MKTTHLRAVEVDVMPKTATMEDGVLYVSRRFELAIHLCACGCRGEAVTPFDKAAPGWELTEGDGGPTLRPSIGHQHWPCGSHYYVTDGRVVAC
jgi:hypothetical protein